MNPRLLYFKRYRMELDLGRPFPFASLPSEYRWLPWDDSLIIHHAEVMRSSFQEHMDTKVFPNFCHLAGCHELIRAIRNRPGFCPGATWLISSANIPVGTVQGVRDPNGWGAIQNIGVLAEFRSQGLGKALLLKAIAGFRAAGCNRIYLEVTAQNEPALRFYRRMGFRSYRTIYKPVLQPEQVPVGHGI